MDNLICFGSYSCEHADTSETFSERAVHQTMQDLAAERGRGRACCPRVVILSSNCDSVIRHVKMRG